MNTTVLKATTEVLKQCLSGFENSIVTIETDNTSYVCENFDWAINSLQLELFDMNSEQYRFHCYRKDIKGVELIDMDYMTLVLNNGFKINVVKS